MAISFVASATNDAVNADDITVSVPTGTQDDDVMLAFYCFADDDTSGTTLSGFTKIDEVADALGANSTVACWYRVASSEPASYTFTGSAAVEDGNVSGVICTFRGVSTTDVLDVNYSRVSHYLKVENDTTPTAQPITTNTDGAWVVLYGATSNNDVTDVGPPTGYDERADIDSGFYRHVEVCTKAIGTAGTETPGAFNHTGILATNETSMFTLALKPASVGQSFTITVPTGPWR